MLSQRFVRLWTPGRSSGIKHQRFYTDVTGAISRNVQPNYITPDIRERLLAEIKATMKNKDILSSTTLRSVVSEVYAADKAASEKISSSAILAILRKATLRRNDSAVQFINASRPDLAEKERREAEVLSAFLPPLLPESEIDKILRRLISDLALEGKGAEALGRTFKAFYSQVDRSSVDTNLVRLRAELLLSKSQK